jgi:hypothetical protein
MQFSDIRDRIRRFNSTSVLQIGSNACWQSWEADSSSSSDWTRFNASRNYVIRIILLASAGNPHRHRHINEREYNNLVQDYYSWKGHTVMNDTILEEEATSLLASIQSWEENHDESVRNWSLSLSEVLGRCITRRHMAGLFMQRLVAFQCAGFGHPNARLQRTVKLIELMDNRSNQRFTKIFSCQAKMDTKVYFRQFYACLALFDGGSGSRSRGFADLSRFPHIECLQELGITADSLKSFIRLNSALYSSQSDDSFRTRVQQDLANVPEHYQPFFYNHLLAKPFIRLTDQAYWLPDPLSLAESCWNQVRVLAVNGFAASELSHILSKSFEDYLEQVLLPILSPSSFERIQEIRNPNSRQDKRCDFLIKTRESYILVECKTCVMGPETGTYFQADKVADLWCRIHSALEQVASTVEAFGLRDKPVIPLILTFYDSIDASIMFSETAKQTDYCARMGLGIPPIVYSIHEFEHWTHDRSLDNWSELKLAERDSSASSFLVKPDNRGHGYMHLNSALIL